MTHSYILAQSFDSNVFQSKITHFDKPVDTMVTLERILKRQTHPSVSEAIAAFTAYEHSLLREAPASLDEHPDVGVYRISTPLTEKVQTYRAQQVAHIRSPLHPLPQHAALLAAYDRKSWEELVYRTDGMSGK